MRFTLALVIFVLSTAQLLPLSATPASYQYPPPGRLINVGGRNLHLNCSGKGSPTVILVAGGSAFSIDWALVQPRVAATTRVCSYDRAGLAWSDSGPADETVEQTINDLHAVLLSAKEKGPYVLVGASIGGIFIRAYQRAFPKEVAGLVFTNSSNRVGKMVKDKGALLWDFTEDELRAASKATEGCTRQFQTREGRSLTQIGNNSRRVGVLFLRTINPASVSSPARVMKSNSSVLRNQG